jgi:hypothetical protein
MREIPAEIDLLIKDRMQLIADLFRFGVLGPQRSRKPLMRRRGARGWRLALKFRHPRRIVSVCTYGRTIVADNEGDLYETITGHRPAWEQVT